MSSGLCLSGKGARARMGVTWESKRTASRSSLVTLFGLIGAVAGLAAWGVVLAAGVLFEFDRPGVAALLLAIPRGALFGVILALVLHAYWRRHPRKNSA